MSRHPAARSSPSGALLIVVLLAAGCGGSVSTATAPPSAEPTPSVAPTDAAPLRPVGVILTADATLAGELGSYTMDGAGADSPWLGAGGIPSLAIGPFDTISVALIDGVPIEDSTAVMAAADDARGSRTQAVPGAHLSADHRVLRLGPIPPGRWVVSVRLVRADGRGDGTTYWAITVR